MNGRPSVMLTPRPKLAYLSTGKPWSWYIASTASAVLQPLGHEQRVGGNRAARVDALAHASRDRRRDHVDVLAAEVARLRRVRIEAGDQDARPRDAEPRCAGRDRARAASASKLARDGRGTSRERQDASWRARRAGRRRPASSPRAARACCSARYSVWPGEGDAGVVDHALLHRRGDHRARTRRTGSRGCARSSMCEHVAARSPGSSVPGRRAAARAARARRRRQRRRGSARSPIATSARRHRARASRTHSSGPMPAGSPEVSAMTGRALALVQPQLDVRLGRAAAAAIPGRPRRPCARAAPGAPACACARATRRSRAARAPGSGDSRTGVRTGWLTSPSFSSSQARSNSGTVSPG